MSAPARPFEPLDLIQLAAVAIVWGLAVVSAKVTVAELPPLFSAMLRFVLVLGCLIWFIKPLPRAHWGKMALLVLALGPVHFALVFVGVHLARHLAPLVVAGQIWAPASLVIAMFLLRERVTPLRWLGVALTFSGVALLAFDPVVFDQGAAVLVTILAALVYAFGTVMVRMVGPVVGPWALQAWIALASVPVLGLSSFVLEGERWGPAVLHASLLTWGCVLFNGVVSAVAASSMLAHLVQKYGVTRTTPYLLTAPIISFAASALLLGDDLTWRILTGAAAAMGGVALVALAERRFKADATEPA